MEVRECHFVGKMFRGTILNVKNVLCEKFTKLRALPRPGNENVLSFVECTSINVIEVLIFDICHPALLHRQCAGIIITTVVARQGH